MYIFHLVKKINETLSLSLFLYLFLGFSRILIEITYFIYFQLYEIPMFSFLGYIK